MNWDEVVGKAKSVVSLAGRKTGAAVEASKLNMTLMQRKSMLQSTYERIGSLVYLHNRKGRKESGLLEICLDEVDELTKEISELSKRIESLTKGVPCPHCGFRNEMGAIYCGSCGLTVEQKD